MCDCVERMNCVMNDVFFFFCMGRFIFSFGLIYFLKKGNIVNIRFFEFGKNIFIEDFMF